MHNLLNNAVCYTKGFRISSETRVRLMRVETVHELIETFADVDRSQPFPPAAMRMTRGKATGIQKKVALPVGYLSNLDDPTPPAGADDDPGDGG
jgi:hypothetical protein